MEVLRMKIVLVGQALFGKDCLEVLLKQGEQVVGVITIPDDFRGRPNPLKDFAREKKIPVFQPLGKSPQRLKDPQVIAIAKDLKPDLFVLAFVSDIMPYSVIKLATLGGINYHPSLLPKYRGGSAINWALINGEKETGITVHYVDEGIDTGDIILQEKVEISPADTVASLYYDKLYPLGVKLIAEAVEYIRKGIAPRIPQNSDKATYQPMITEEDVIIDWKNGAEEIYNLIRGSNPSPGAQTIFRGETIKIWEAQIIPSSLVSEPGEVAEIMEGQGFTVGTGNEIMLIKKVQQSGKAKISAEQFSKQVDLKPGESMVG
ncbi:MAG: methionyl-tRNA formyltransferase [Firmicutes bacterium HGW-Firmicutes-17]|nr:MAG: methionyl-tRNA formyltransferase [Firmicutes bacterium HGW-Firmicutes-17]